MCLCVSHVRRKYQQPSTGCLPTMWIMLIKFKIYKCQAHCLISTASVSLEQPHLLPPSSLLASPYLNEHPRHGDDIIHFWHFSAKSSMEAKTKTERRAFCSLSDSCLFHRETDSRDTLCRYVACLSKIHYKQTVHWLVL